MPAGLPYFAWVDASETTFTSGHMRWDESVFSFKLSQEEGDPASLTAVVRRPQNEAGNSLGLLGPGRKIWAWFALDCGPGLVKFRGRLVGIPTSIFEDLVTLEFVAKPVDLVAQKEALAASLRVLPYYDEAVIDPQRRSDPDVVLEGYTKIWAYDPVTHIVTVSDEITGEDGLVEFDGGSEDGKVLYDGLGLTLTSGPLARVDLTAEYTWTQQARGTVDLTDYLTSSWPDAINGAIPSLNAADWPKPGAGIGNGWVVEESSAQDLRNTVPKTETTGGGGISKGFEGNGGSSTSWSQTVSYLGFAPALFQAAFGAGAIITNNTTNVSYSTDGDGRSYMSSFSTNFSSVTAAIVVQEIKPTLVAGYTAERQCTESVSLTLVANVQPILTDPEDGEALRLDGIRSVNLSEELQIIDPRRRSYIATERGNRSLEHLIALARAHLMKRARVVEITFVPKLARMPEITLRKNAFLAEPRVGEAVGKIIGYSVALDGSDGRINCEVRIGCTIGRGGLVTATNGTPTYCSTNYVGFDYQQFVERTVLVDAFTDSSVGYQPPNAAPNDDGINFMSALTAENVIEVGLVVEHGPDPEDPEEQEDIWHRASYNGGPVNDASERVAARAEYIKNTILPQYNTRAKFKLKNMTGSFSTDYELQTTDLKIPTGYDLEAV